MAELYYVYIQMPLRPLRPDYCIPYTSVYGLMGEVTLGAFHDSSTISHSLILAHHTNRTIVTRRPKVNEVLSPSQITVNSRLSRYDTIYLIVP